MATMAELADGVRVLHAPSATEGTITVEGRKTWVSWYNEPGSHLVSNHGTVYPADLVVIDLAGP